MLEQLEEMVERSMVFRNLKLVYHCMGPCGISVQFVIDLYRGGRFVAATNHTVKMCIDLLTTFWTSTSQ